MTQYVPHPFWDQFDHLGNIAYKYRQPPNVHKTKIRFGQRDMYLQVKPPGLHVWHVSNLPTLGAQHLPDLSVSPSLAPGRTRATGPKRAASGSPEPRISKASRSESDNLENNGDTEVETVESDNADDRVNAGQNEMNVAPSSKPADSFL